MWKSSICSVTSGKHSIHQIHCNSMLFIYQVVYWNATIYVSNHQQPCVLGTSWPCLDSSTAELSRSMSSLAWATKMSWLVEEPWKDIWKDQQTTLCDDDVQSGYHKQMSKYLKFAWVKNPSKCSMSTLCISRKQSSLVQRVAFVRLQCKQLVTTKNLQVTRWM